MKRHIITGAPSTGKTTLIHALRKKGYNVFDEISRDVIINQQNKSGDKTPWQDMLGFTNLVYHKTINELSIPIQKESFVDRSLVDIIAYLKLKNLSIKKELLEFNYKKYYNSYVFMLPIWEEIYTQDPQRLQSLEVCKQIQYLLINTYQELGFSIYTLAKESPEKRIESIERIIQSKEVFL